MPHQVGDRPGRGKPNQSRVLDDPAGTAMPVLHSTIPASDRRHATAQPIETAPPQSWPAIDDRAVDVQGVDHVAKIADPLGVAPLTDPFGETHAELIDGDHPVAIAQPGEHAAPQKRPGRVAVHTHNRADGCAARADVRARASDACRRRAWRHRRGATTAGSIPHRRH